MKLFNASAMLAAVFALTSCADYNSFGYAHTGSYGYNDFAHAPVHAPIHSSVAVFSGSRFLSHPNQFGFGPHYPRHRTVVVKPVHHQRRQFVNSHRNDRFSGKRDFHRGHNNGFSPRDQRRSFDGQRPSRDQRRSFDGQRPSRDQRPARDQRRSFDDQRPVRVNRSDRGGRGNRDERNQNQERQRPTGVTLASNRGERNQSRQSGAPRSNRSPDGGRGGRSRDRGGR